MNIILLSGGSGKRLWPLSNDVRSKQFIKIFKNSEGERESMLQRMYRSIKKIDSSACITIATSKNQVPLITNQIGSDVNISVEPCRRDTFPAIALATAYLCDVLKVGEDESVIVCPVDPYVEDDYFEALKNLNSLSENNSANLCLMGIKPTYPSVKYGYIIPSGNESVSMVRSFKEKPDESAAKVYIKDGALWNSGVFAYKIGYLLKKVREMIGFSDYQKMYDEFQMMEKISFDYAVAEKERNIAVMRFDGNWKDLGTWNTLTEAMNEKTVGNVILSDNCTNVHAINNLGMPLFVMGMKDVIISSCPDGIIVTDKIQSSYIKPYVDRIDSSIRVADKHWGNYLVLDTDENSHTVKISVKADESISFHRHRFRDEVWIVISGNGSVFLGEKERKIKAGDVISIPIGVKHSVKAATDLQMIEVQIGNNISADDIERFNE